MLYESILDIWVERTKLPNFYSTATSDSRLLQGTVSLEFYLTSSLIDVIRKFKSDGQTWNGHELYDHEIFFLRQNVETLIFVNRAVWTEIRFDMC